MLPAKLDLHNLNTQEFTAAQWSDFKKYIDGTFAYLSFAYDDYGSSAFYMILTEAWGGLHKKIVLVQGSAEAIDFIDNFSAADPRQPESNVTLSEIAEKKTKVQKRFDLAGATTMYIGVSPLGSAASASVWVIKKLGLVDDNPTQLQWSANNVKWDDRTTTSYS